MCNPHQAPPVVFDEPVGDHEEEIQSGITADGFLFAGDPPLEDID